MGAAKSVGYSTQKFNAASCARGPQPEVSGQLSCVPSVGKSKLATAMSLSLSPGPGLGRGLAQCPELREFADAKSTARRRWPVHLGWCHTDSHSLSLRSSLLHSLLKTGKTTQRVCSLGLYL